MPGTLENRADPMISELLRTVNDSGDLTAKQMRDLLNVSNTQVYRYLSGETEISFSQVRALFRQSRCPAFQDLVLGELLDGTDLVAQRLDVGMDANRDGEVNTSDVVDGAIHGARNITKTLDRIRRLETSGSPITGPDAVRTQDEIRDTIKVLMAASKTVAFLADRSAAESRDARRRAKFVRPVHV